MKRIGLVILFLAACEGSISGFGENGPLQSDNNQNDPANNTIVDDPFPDVECRGIACEEATISPSPRLVRLTHNQWSRATRDLLLLADAPDTQNFVEDVSSEGSFDNFFAVLDVREPLWQDYREAAESIALQVAEDSTALNQLLPADAPTDLGPRVESFVRHFGKRAYRRPLTDVEVNELIALSEDVPDLFPGAPSFELHAEYLIRFMLQSPNFLYRIELNDSDGNVVALNGFERASRLSFALWNSMPDDRLFDAAEAGELDTTEGVQAQVDRMMQDEKFIETVIDFHGQILKMDLWRDIDKNAERYPNFNAGQIPMYREEMERFVTHIVFQREGGWTDLLNSKTAFLNAELAGLYGVEGAFDDTYKEATLPPERAGIFTRIGLLAFKANAFDPSPIKRGVFINEHITCSSFQLPPDDFTLPDGVEGDTNRERTTNATKECGAQCHAVDIDPPGFALEGFGADGVTRDTDNGFPIDTAASWHLEDTVFEFTDAVDLAQKISATDQSHVCYAEHWFEYIFGRLVSENDEPYVHKVGQASKDGNANVKDVVKALVTSDLFLNRAKE